jgi:hypothetical protein
MEKVVPYVFHSAASKAEFDGMDYLLNDAEDAGGGDMRKKRRRSFG